MKTRGKNISIVVGLLILVAFGPVAAFADPILSVETPGSPVTIGDTFDVFVNITDVADLYAFQFDINFDPAILSAVGVTEGAFMPGGGTTFFLEGTIDNLAGTINFTANTLIGAIVGVSGSGTLAKINFQALSEGTSPISLLNTVLLDSTISDISFSSTIGTMNPVSSVPEPSTMLLLSSGLIGFVSLRRKIRE